MEAIVSFRRLSIVLIDPKKEVTPGKSEAFGYEDEEEGNIDLDIAIDDACDDEVR